VAVFTVTVRVTCQRPVLSFQAAVASYPPPIGTGTVARTTPSRPATSSTLAGSALPRIPGPGVTVMVTSWPGENCPRTRITFAPSLRAGWVARNDGVRSGLVAAVVATAAATATAAASAQAVAAASRCCLALLALAWARAIS
jgi:hypothetical protein